MFIMLISAGHVISIIGKTYPPNQADHVLSSAHCDYITKTGDMAWSDFTCVPLFFSVSSLNSII